MILTWILFIAGLAIMVFSGDKFVDSATLLAKKTGIPNLLIGATVVALSTTIPEFTVSTMSVAAGDIDLAIGNAVGSIICNTAFIVAITLTLRTTEVGKDFRSKAGFLLLSLVAIIVFSLDGQVVFWEALILYGILIAYFYVNVMQSRKAMKYANEESKSSVDQSYYFIFLVFIISIVGVIVGSRLLIDNGIKIAEYLGVPTAVIALTMIALGTSLPELVTTIGAIRKGEGALSIGNVVGANILNIVFILGTCAVVATGGIPLTETMVMGEPFALTQFVDLPLALLVTLIFVVPPMVKGRTYRWQGILLLLIYVAYLAFLFIAVR